MTLICSLELYCMCEQVSEIQCVRPNRSCLSVKPLESVAVSPSQHQD